MKLSRSSVLSNLEFAEDLRRAQSGKLSDADISRLIEKWGARGAAFYSFIRGV